MMVLLQRVYVLPIGHIPQLHFLVLAANHNQLPLRYQHHILYRLS